MRLFLKRVRLHHRDKRTKLKDYVKKLGANENK